ncbi:MAG TPA: hypothetical protein VI795_03190 [Patescibacteria group bacterium]|nr:hypothetical protein [Patescibacteria group bacterium]
MNLKDIEQVWCPLGKMTIPARNIKFGLNYGDSILTGRTGVCEECKRKWIEVVPGAKNITPIQVTIEVSENRNNMATITSCNDVYSNISY